MARKPFVFAAFAAATAHETRNFLSATLGDHMVLQRAPQSAVVWGHTAPEATVTTTFGGATFETTADGDGTWRQRLPPTAASATPRALTFASTSGEAAAVRDVLFGDVFLCGGQSNMQFTVPAAADGRAEARAADAFTTVRVFTVGEGNGTSASNFSDLQTVAQPWAVASNASVYDPRAGDAVHADWGSYFSAVCWTFGRALSEALGDVPIGLVSNNWGGTKIELWMPTTAPCKKKDEGGDLYRTMIHPYAVGPMAVAGFAWCLRRSLFFLVSPRSDRFPGTRASRTWATRRPRPTTRASSRRSSARGAPRSTRRTPSSVSCI